MGTGGCARGCVGNDCGACVSCELRDFRYRDTAEHVSICVFEIPMSLFYLSTLRDRGVVCRFHLPASLENALGSVPRELCRGPCPSGPHCEQPNRCLILSDCHSSSTLRNTWSLRKAQGTRESLANMSELRAASEAYSAQPTFSDNTASQASISSHRVSIFIAKCQVAIPRYLCPSSPTVLESYHNSQQRT